jgi:hypothetical protein
MASYKVHYHSGWHGRGKARLGTAVYISQLRGEKIPEHKGWLSGRRREKQERGEEEGEISNHGPLSRTHDNIFCT